MVRVENGTVTATRLPRTGRLANGRSVSNYHLLAPGVLLAEGWLPLVEDRPEFDPETEYLRFSHHEISPDSVTAVYEVVAMDPEPDPP